MIWLAVLAGLCAVVVPLLCLLVLSSLVSLVRELWRLVDTGHQSRWM